MKSAINDLVSMRDVESLLELLNESEDGIEQLEVAEGLAQLGDRRGLEYLLIARESEDEEISQYADEILDSPNVKRMRDEMEAEERAAHQKRLDAAKIRLQKGKKVYLNRVIYLPASDILQEDLSGSGFHIRDLDEAGLEGWEVVHILPRRRQLLVGSVDDHFVGAYVFLKKELTPDEIAEAGN